MEVEKYVEVAKETYGRIGIELTDEQLKNIVVIANDFPVLNKTAESSGVYTIPLKVALKEFDWVKDLMWKLVSPEKDEYTKMIYESNVENGYFVYVKKGVEVKDPIMACTFLALNRFQQLLHNIIYVDEGAKVYMINGCASANYVGSGKHYSVTETYVKKRGMLNFTMIHDWAPEVEVRTRTGVIVEEEGVYVSNYISLKEALLVQGNPQVYLKTKAKAYLNSIIYSPKGSTYEMGGSIYLEGEGASGEIFSNTISSGGITISPVKIEAKANGTKGHIECNALLLEEGGVVKTIPELSSYVEDTQLSHEASIGKLSEEELIYLMARGLSEDEAKKLLIRGFIDIERFRLPENLKKEVEKVVNLFEGREGL